MRGGFIIRNLGALDQESTTILRSSVSCVIQHTHIYIHTRVALYRMQACYVSKLRFHVSCRVPDLLSQKFHFSR
jgi:hypothetical protein